MTNNKLRRLAAVGGSLAVIAVGGGYAAGAFASAGTPTHPSVRIAPSAKSSTEKVHHHRGKHHRGHGGISYIYCRSPRDVDSVARTLHQLAGVEKVLTRTEAVKLYRLMPSRIGDLVVLGDRDTVFGELETEKEDLPAEYRTHGSMYESHVPLVLHNAPASISKFDFHTNRDLARWLYV